MSESHPTTQVNQRDYQLVEETTEQQLENQPMELCSKNRLYTTTRQRERLGIDNDSFGRGTLVEVWVTTVDRQPQWNGVSIQSAAFRTQLRTYGAIGVPQSLIERFDLDVGDNLRVNIKLL